MPTITTQVTNVQDREIPRRDGSGTFTLHEVLTADGGKFTARRDVANVARQYIGHPVQATIRTEQKGNYTNHYLDHIELANGANPPTIFQPPAPIHQPQTTTSGNAGATYQQYPAQPPYQAVLPPQPSQAPQSLLTDKNDMIFRQVAAKVSAVLSKTQTEFWSNCDDLVRYFGNGTKPMTAEQATLNTLGSMAANNDPNSYYAPPPGDNEIPF